MPIDFEEAAKAVEGGLSAVCSVCRKYWEGLDKGLATCTARDGCRGPLNGGDFHEYDGPIPVRRFSERCFVCGQQAGVAVRIAESERLFGVCQAHVGMFQRSTGVIVPAYFVVEGGEVPVDRYFDRPRKQTLLEFIDEVESYYAHKEGRPWKSLSPED